MGSQVSDCLAFATDDVREVLSNGRTFDYEETIRLTTGHRGCFGNLAEALAPFGVEPDAIPVAFNLFMNVPIDADSGKISVLPPTSQPGDFIRLRAAMDCIIGLTACSVYDSRGGSFKPIHYEIA